MANDGQKGGSPVTISGAKRMSVNAVTVANATAWTNESESNGAVAGAIVRRPDRVNPQTPTKAAMQATDEAESDP